SWTVFVLFLAPAARVCDPLSLHDALPISPGRRDEHIGGRGVARDLHRDAPRACAGRAPQARRALASRGRGRSGPARARHPGVLEDRKSTRLNSSHEWISYAVFCLKKKKTT